jgi:predicted transcriptional regulator
MVFRMPIRGPSIKALKEKLGLTADQAITLKTLMNEGFINKTLSAANEYLKGYGLEVISRDSSNLNVIIEYVNMGDTYKTTFYYNHESGRFYIGSWGDYVESHLNEVA